MARPGAGGYAGGIAVGIQPRRGDSGGAMDRTVNGWAVVTTGPRSRVRDVAKGLALAAFVGATAVAPDVGAEIFVTNDSSSSVTVYAGTANGNQSPARQITGLTDTPRGIAADTVNGEILVATQSGTLFVYSINANGAASTLRTITGGNDFQGVHVDTVNNEIFIADRGDSSIRVYARTDSGAAVPLRTVDVGAEPRGVFVDTVANELVVTVPDRVLVYSRTATGAAATLRDITWSTPPGDLSQVFVDRANDEIVVANHGSSAIRVWSRTASGDVAPLRSIIGASTLLDSPRGVAFCPGTNEYVAAARNNDLLTTYSRTAVNDVPPQRTISGPATQLSSPRFLAVTGSCSAIASVSVPATDTSALLVLLALLGLAGMFQLHRRRT